MNAMHNINVKSSKYDDSSLDLVTLLTYVTIAPRLSKWLNHIRSNRGLKVLSLEIKFWVLSKQRKGKRSVKSKIRLLEYKGLKNSLYNYSSTSTIRHTH